MATLMDNRLLSELSLYFDVLVELLSRENPQTQHVRRMENGHIPCQSAGVSSFLFFSTLPWFAVPITPGRTLTKTFFVITVQDKNSQASTPVNETPCIRKSFQWQMYKFDLLLSQRLTNTFIYNYRPSNVLSLKTKEMCN